MRLWIDDERPMPRAFTHRTTSSRASIELLSAELAAGRTVELISFDHDLDWPPETAREDDTARPVLTWIVETGFWPAELRFHTANLDGHEWMVELAMRHAPATTVVDVRDIWA